MTDRIYLQALTATHAQSADVNFRVTTSAGDPLPIEPSDFGAVVTLPESPRPFDIVVSMTPTSPSYWPVQAEFHVERSGVVTADPANEATEFRPPFGAQHSALGRTTFIQVYLTRLRDCTEQARAKLVPRSPNFVPDNHVWSTPTGNDSWEPSWTVRPASIPVLDDVDYTTEERPQFSEQTVSPATEVLIVEVAGPPPQVPQLLAVAWPSVLRRAEKASAPSYLVYFHASYHQNVAAGYYADTDEHPYPFGWDYLFFGVWRYLFYAGDPLRENHFAKGLVYQIEAAGRPAVLVLPVHHPNAELGELDNARFMEEILLEIQAFMFRREGNYAWPKTLGRTALAGFSASNQLLQKFLRNSHRQEPQSDFYRSTLKEVYSFDCPNSYVSRLASSLRRWCTTGDTDKMVRIYNQHEHDAFDDLVDAEEDSDGCLLQSSDGLRSVMVARQNQWPDAEATYTGPSRDWWKAVHQLISGMLLVDALRRGFP